MLSHVDPLPVVRSCAAELVTAVQTSTVLHPTPSRTPTGKRSAPAGTAIRGGKNRVIVADRFAALLAWAGHRAQRPGDARPLPLPHHASVAGEQDGPGVTHRHAARRGRTGDTVEVVVGRNLDRRPCSAGRAAHVDSPGAADGDAGRRGRAGHGVERRRWSRRRGRPLARGAVEAAVHATGMERTPTMSAPLARRRRTQ